MKIVILPSAMEDLAEGFQFYERKEPGLGTYFLDSLFSDIDSLQLYAGIHRRVFDHFRLLSKRFPFAIYYSKQADAVHIKAVLDCRRDPKRTRRQLK